MLKRLWEDKSGNFGSMMAGALLLLMGGVGLSLDYMAMTDISAELQSATDRAALIASSSAHLSEADRIKAANISFINLSSASGTINSHFDFTEDTIIVSAQLDYKPIILGIFGHGTQSIGVTSATPNSEFSGVDVSLVLDVTGSMKGSKLANLQNSVDSFLSEFEEFDTDVRVAVVPFSQYVNIRSGGPGTTPVWVNNDGEGTSFSPAFDPVPVIAADGTSATPTDLKVWDGCVGSRLGLNNDVPEYGGLRFPAVYQDGLEGDPFGTLTRYECPEPLLPLTDNLDTVRTKVNGLSAAGRTAIPAGLMWGWRTLDERLPFPNVTTGKPRQKILVLMTDGGNTITQTPGAAYHWDNKAAPGFGDVVSRSNNLTTDICTSINTMTDITIYSIAFDINSPAVIDLVRNCAATTDRFFDADAGGSSLEDAFASIGAGLVKLRLLN